MNFHFMTAIINLILFKQSDHRVMHPLMQAVIKGVKENDLKYCVESIIRERVRRDDAGGPRVLDPNNLLSVYRESLFLTLVSLGQDNIDLTAFDRYDIYLISSTYIISKDDNNTFEIKIDTIQHIIYNTKLYFQRIPKSF